MTRRPLPLLLIAACRFVSYEATPTDDDDTLEAAAFAEGPRVEVLDDDPSSSSDSGATSSSAELDTASDSSSSDEGDSSSSSGYVRTSSSSSTGEDLEGSSSSDHESSSSTGIDPCACCSPSSEPGCELPAVEACTCAWDDGTTSADFCCYFAGSWGEFCVDVAIDACGLDCSAC